MYYSAETAALNAILGIFSTIWLLVLAFFVINIVANWKIFTKAHCACVSAAGLGIHRSVL